jgi:hypothetical protein
MSRDRALDPGWQTKIGKVAASADAIALDQIRHATEASRISHTMLSQESYLADIEYRILALHAGPLHRVTLDAKRHAIRLAALLGAETLRLSEAGHGC